MKETIIARFTNDGEAKVVRSLLETYGIPSTLTYDVPNLVYPNNVGEIRISVPPGTEEEALGILAAHNERIGAPRAAHVPGTPSPFPQLAPLAAAPPFDEEEEEEEEDDEEEWDDEDDDGGEDDDVAIDGEGLGDDEETDLDDDDDLFDDEE